MTHTESLPCDGIPKVSIGLAVFNGESYLRKAIDSILAQTFTDFELIISDNASIDRTEAICREYAIKDDRIRYHRNAINIGGANNENLTFRMSIGQYFRWAAHDDLCAPRLLEKSVAILDRDPSVVLCYSTIVQIDEGGKQIGILDREMACSSEPYQRFRELANWHHNCETSYGLVRSHVLRQTELQPNYTDSDRTLLCELSLYGRFHKLSEPLFYKRYHCEMSTQVYPKFYDRMAWFFPHLKDCRSRVFFPSWQKLFHYLRAIARAPLTSKTRLLCWFHALCWIVQAHWKSLSKEIFRYLVNLLLQLTKLDKSQKPQSN
jgi:glycosyltransferase involved in cell wall biosynthesis